MHKDKAKQGGRRKQQRTQTATRAQSALNTMLKEHGEKTRTRKQLRKKSEAPAKQDQDARNQGTREGPHTCYLARGCLQAKVGGAPGEA